MSLFYRLKERSRLTGLYKHALLRSDFEYSQQPNQALVLNKLYSFRIIRNREREILSELPVILESLILLVESGLGVLPAIHKLIETNQSGLSQETNSESVRFYLRQVHELSVQGLSFEQALQIVAESCPYLIIRHSFLHLDIGANVGGRLGGALRSLAKHAHEEWRLSVERRVRRLENLSVFPVFGSVIGLILIISAVPLIPLLELGEKLERTSAEYVIDKSN